MLNYASSVCSITIHSLTLQDLQRVEVFALSRISLKVFWSHWKDCDALVPGRHGVNMSCMPQSTLDALQSAMQVIGENVMMTVATSDIRFGPARLLYPRFIASASEGGRFPYSLLGERLGVLLDSKKY